MKVSRQDSISGSLAELEQMLATIKHVADDNYFVFQQDSTSAHCTRATQPNCRRAKFSTSAFPNSP